MTSILPGAELQGIYLKASWHEYNWSIIIYTWWHNSWALFCCSCCCLMALPVLIDILIKDMCISLSSDWNVIWVTAVLIYIFLLLGCFNGLLIEIDVVFILRPVILALIIISTSMGIISILIVCMRFCYLHSIRL